MVNWGQLDSNNEGFENLVQMHQMLNESQKSLNIPEESIQLSEFKPQKLVQRVNDLYSGQIG